MLLSIFWYKVLRVSSLLLVLFNIFKGFLKVNTISLTRLNFDEIACILFLILHCFVFLYSVYIPVLSFSICKVLPHMVFESKYINF